MTLLPGSNIDKSMSTTRRASAPEATNNLDFREWLISLPDERLVRMVHPRPDTALPLPPDFTALAARLSLRPSIARAISELDAVALAALEAAADLGADIKPLSAPEVVEEIKLRAQRAPSKARLEAGVQALLDAGIAYGTPDSFQLHKAAAGLAGGRVQVLPGRLAPAGGSPAAVLASGEEVRAALHGITARQHKILETLVHSGGRGITRDAAPDADPKLPSPGLIAKGLLARVDEQSVRLPRPVHDVLLGREPATIPLLPPSPKDSGTDQRALDERAAATAVETLQRLAALTETLSQDPVALLRNDSVGVRQVTRLAKELGWDQEELGRLVHLGVQAGILGRGEPRPEPKDDEGANYLGVTAQGDAWLAADWAER